MTRSQGGLGIPQLDHLLEPIPHGSTIALVNDPGVEAEPFLHQAVHRHLEAGGEVVYAATNRLGSALRWDMAAGGFDTSRHADRLHLVDLYGPLMGLSEPVAYAVRDPTSLEEVTATFERAAREHGEALLVIDSLSDLADRAGLDAFERLLPRLQLALRRFPLAVSLFTRWPYGGDVEALLEPFHAVVSLRGVEDRVQFSQFFAVERAAWQAAVDAKPRLYKVAKPGGVLVYVPKILVTGPHDAGKSTFVHAVSDRARSADHQGTTVALDHGHVTIDGLTADLFGTPGQSRFDPILKTLASQALGVIVVVDATDPASFPRARAMLQQTWKAGLPAIIAANKQDAPGALGPQAVALGMGMPRDVQVVPCRANDAASARAVLRSLLDQILSQGLQTQGVTR